MGNHQKWPPEMTARNRYLISCRQEVYDRRIVQRVQRRDQGREAVKSCTRRRKTADSGAPGRRQPQSGDVKTAPRRRRYAADDEFLCQEHRGLTTTATCLRPSGAGGGSKTMRFKIVYPTLSRSRRVPRLNCIPCPPPPPLTPTHEQRPRPPWKGRSRAEFAESRRRESVFGRRNDLNSALSSAKFDRLSRGSDGPESAFRFAK